MHLTGLAERFRGLFAARTDTANEKHAIETYRPDIDGLRAIAVLSVFAFHLDAPVLHGGFTGVDIFFVISGYLIGARVSFELRARTFSIFAFWERRVRRIFPAFAAMMAAALVAAYFLMLPNELTSFASSFIAAVLSVSNIWFYLHSGYFSNLSTTQPLLHTWSLAVEEQFYVVLPAILWLVIRFAPRWEVRILSLIAVLSLILAAFGAYMNPEATFYLLPTRMWELLLGTLVAAGLAPKIRPALGREAAAAVGLLLIAAGFLLINKSTPFPGLAAIPSCLGTAMIIHVGQSGSSTVTRGLAFKPLVWVGLISYSLYLWHWPVIIFAEHYAPALAGMSHRLLAPVIVVVAFVGAWLSWRFVEQPLRRRSAVGRSQLFLGAGLAALLLSVLGGGALAAGGLPGRFPAKELTAASYLAYKSADYTREGRCFITSSGKFSDYQPGPCLKLDPARKNVLVVGDSYAAHYVHGLVQAWPEVNFLQATSSGCRPTEAQPSSAAGRCVAMFDFIYHRFLPATPVDGLIVAGRWHADDLPRVAALLAWARQRHLPVSLIGPIQQYDAPLPRLLAWSIQYDDPSLPVRHLLKGVPRIDRDLAAIARAAGTPYYSPYGLMCGQGRGCPGYASPDVPLQYDDGHVTRRGSEFLAATLKRAGLTPAAPKP